MIKNRPRGVFSTAMAICIAVSLIGSVIPVRGEEGGDTTYLPLVVGGTHVSPPLVVSSDSFSGQFSPFYASTASDSTIVGITQLNILTTDRRGEVVSSAIDGETRDYLGTDYLYTGPADTSVTYDETADQTTYRATLREDLLFSDGVPVSADDLIFTYYTFLDPNYSGPYTLNSYPILGLRNYQTQTTDAVYLKYDQMYADIYNAGRAHAWSASDPWSQAQQLDLWDRLDAGVMDEMVKIVDFVFQNYLSEAEMYTGYTADQISASEKMQIMFGIVVWGYGTIYKEGDKSLTTRSGQVFDLITEFPTLQDFCDEIWVYYTGNIRDAFPNESPDGTNVYEKARKAFILYWGPLDDAMGGQGIPNISGVVRVDDYTVEVITEGISAPAVYSLLGIPIAPLHYYGDLGKYDYEKNHFGFDFGDLSKQNSLSEQPLGAGPYRFDRYEEGVVYLEASQFYYKGVPKTQALQLVEMNKGEVPSGVRDGLVDLGAAIPSTATLTEISSYNSNGEYSGNVITTSLVENLGYGYIGLNAHRISVDGMDGSKSSRDLRKGLATVLAIYREEAIQAYYGDIASVINYPISNSSWAAPQATDPDYRVAFAVDVDGNPIYTAGMTAEERHAAAEAAALGFFEAAGYTVVDGRLTAAPAGAKLTYQLAIPGGGVGDHPAYAAALGAQASLAKIGMTLNIWDPVDFGQLWNALYSGSIDLWAAAWGSSIDPDMYPKYHSDSVPGAGGSNWYYIVDAQLDQLIEDARMSTDQEARKLLYKQALDIIMDWGVEVPNYQRKQLTVCSSERIRIETLTPDMTTFWGWTKEIELLEMQD